ncbi:MAG TPA: UDP-N-acetylglucosamine--N-acetylmuramyl-(pentapeptide) pyrophosphoryl-undecaprenol N-acetylglucosamine transferase [Candidatus Eremiobacteraceae bacterium]|jgi:UDP-N-acetylglucosamine--N-acetylmuramyl-(pentapeptide) pyrophosphoryl-undecaprenol N-acetylglucosamine transferase|nr:UDP-N-acetylglucosamine--N-acetylmuramyl-(pentapeptide) pyrophosphoryl-undecaprenol N-acetylglucosamine transferase [Candidatus Eremiobacteraceae bacterium]
MRVLFSGGGTGGHIYPMLSLAQALLRGDSDAGVCEPTDKTGRSSDAGARNAIEQSGSAKSPAVLFVGAEGNVDEELLTRDGIPYKTVGSKPLAGKSGLASALSLAGNAAAVAQALPIVSHFRPDVIVGGGGYACAPAVLAGAILRRAGRLPRLRITLIEPNVMPGLANRRLARYANEIWGGYADCDTSRHFADKFRLTGIPVRADLYTPIAKSEARRSLGLDPDRFTVLVFGGSQGARTINVATSGMVARRRLPTNWQVLHLSGKRDYEWMVAERKREPNDNHYVVKAYLDRMALAYWAADLVLCRAGASTLAEVATVGLPAIFVPYPHASEDHQRANADYFVDRGAALTMMDGVLTPDSLYWMIIDAAEPQKLSGITAALQRLARPRAVETMLARLLDTGPTLMLA